MGLYEQIEDKWYSLLDRIQAAGVPVYSVVNPVEGLGVPSLPFVALAVLLVVVLAGVFAFAPASEDNMLIVMVSSGGIPVEGASVVVGELTDVTNGNGVVFLSLAPGGGEYGVEVTKTGCESIVASGASPGTLELEMVCMQTPATGSCIEVSEDLETTQLLVEGMPPLGCKVRARPYWDQTREIPTKWKIDAAGTLHLSTPQESCPTNNDYIEISCSNAHYLATIKEFFTDALTKNVIELEKKEKATGWKEDDRGEAPEFEDEWSGEVGTFVDEGATITVLPIAVKVVSKSRINLEGIVVKAVDDEGYELTTGLESVLQATTSSSGVAQITLPAGTVYRLSVYDPRGAYQSSTTQEYTAKELQEIRIEMEEGEPTTIYIKKEDRQTPIAGARVAITKDGAPSGFPIATSLGGTIRASLLHGAAYSISVTHPSYESVDAVVTGGGDVTIYLAPLDPTKAGSLSITINSATGTKEPMSAVRVQLIKDGRMHYQAVTDKYGTVVFPTVYAGSYDVQASPPGTVYYSNIETAEVSAGEKLHLDLSLAPMQITIVFLPLVEISEGKEVPKENVETEFWNAEYEEVVEAKVTDYKRTAEYKVDRGTYGYFVGTFTGDKQWGPVTTSPRLFLTDSVVIAVLREAPEDAVVKMELREKTGLGVRSLSPGKEYDAIVSVALPEYLRGTGYDKTTVEFYAGEAGELKDSSKTPVVIDTIDLIDIAVENPQVSSLMKADEYSAREIEEDHDDPSKYIAVVLGEYTPPTWYDLRVPLYVRALAEKGATEFHYRATWEKSDKKVEGEWQTSIAKILPGDDGGLWAIDNPLFYGYTAKLSQTLKGRKAKEISTTKGSVFYLHVHTKAKADSNDWEIPIASVGDTATVIGYEGFVGGAEIPFTPRTTWGISNSNQLFGVEIDEEIDLVVYLRAENPGRASLAVFNDMNNILTYDVGEVGIAESETDVSGLGVTLEMKAEMSEGQWGIFVAEEETLPANAKDIEFVFGFKTDSSHTIKMKVVPSTNGMEYYEREALYVEDGSEHVVAAYGGEYTGGELEVYIAEASADYGEPVFTIEYGPVDYDIALGAYEGTDAANKITENADRLVVKVTKRDGEGAHDQGRGVLKQDKAQVWVNNVKKDARYSDADNYFTLALEEPLDNEYDVIAEAESDKFGIISRTYAVSGLDIEPAGRHLYSGEVALNTEVEFVIEVTNDYETETEIEIGELERKGWKFETGVVMFSEEGMQLPNDLLGVFIPPKGMAQITLTARADTVECSEGVGQFIIKSEKLAEDEVFLVHLACTISGADVSTPTAQIKDYVRRDPTLPEAMDKWGCSPDEDYTYLCDAGQVSMAVLDAADELIASDEELSHAYTYAIGNDWVTVVELNEMFKGYAGQFKHLQGVVVDEDAAALTESKDLAFDGILGCGVWKVTLRKVNDQNDVVAEVEEWTEDGEALWCDGTQWQYFMGLMNFDRDLRPMRGRYMAFDNSKASGKTMNEMFVGAIDWASGNPITYEDDAVPSSVDTGLVFSYDAAHLSARNIVSARTGGQANSFVRYVECKPSNLIDCPKFAIDAWNNYKDEEAVLGFYNIDQYNDVVVGIVYDNTKITAPEEGVSFTDELTRLRAAFAVRLVQFWTTGELSDAWTGGVHKEMIYHAGEDDTSAFIDLKGPEVTGLTLLGVGFDDGRMNTELTSRAEVDVIVQVQTEYAEDEPLPRCLVYNIAPGGEKSGTQDCMVQEQIAGGFRFFCPTFQLLPGEGLKHVGAFCIDSVGIASRKVVSWIVMDESGIEVLGLLPGLTTMGLTDANEASVLMRSFRVRDKYAEPEFCWLELGGELPFETEGFRAKDAYTQVNECNAAWETDANGKNTVRPFAGGDDNADEVVDDGCCKITIAEGSGTDEQYYFNVAEVTCQSPKIGVEDVYVPANVFCYDAVGHMKKLGEIEFWRWGHDYPMVEIFDDFAFSTTILEEGARVRTNEEKELTAFTFYDYNTNVMDKIAYGVYSQEKEGRRVLFRGTGNSVWKNNFTLGFEAEDDDGVSVCEAFVETTQQEWDYENLEFKETLLECTECTQNSGCCSEVRCSSSNVVGEGMFRQNVECPLMLPEGKNAITVKCADRTGKVTVIEHEYVRDETPPKIVGEVNIEDWGVSDEDGVKLNSPEIHFDVLDDYTSIDTCTASVKLLQPEDMVLDYMCTPTATMETVNAQKGDKRHVECILDDPVSGEKLTLPIILMDFGSKDEDGNANMLYLRCNDTVGNTILPNDEENSVHSMDVAGPNTKQFYKDVMSACKLVRFSNTQSGIERQGFFDLGEEGSAEISDLGFGPFGFSMDEEGVFAVVRYSEGDSISWNALEGHYDNNRPKLYASGTWDITVRVSCIQQAACMTVINLISGKVADAAIKPGIAQMRGFAVKRMKDATVKTLKEAFEKITLKNARAGLRKILTKWTSGITKKFSEKFAYKVIKLSAKGTKFKLFRNIGTLWMGRQLHVVGPSHEDFEAASDELSQAADDRLANDFTKCDGCEFEESGQVKQLIAETVVSVLPLGDVLQATVPDDYQLLYYGPTIEGGKTYLMVAQVQRLDLTASDTGWADPVVDELGKCVASCRDYACMVTMVPETPVEGTQRW